MLDDKLKSTRSRTESEQFYDKLEMLPILLRETIKRNNYLNAVPYPTGQYVVDFLIAANNNPTLDGTQPVAFLSDVRGVRVRAISVAEQVALLDTESYKMLGLPNGRQVLLILASKDKPLTSLDIAGPIGTLEKVAARVDMFLGNLFFSRWLHVELYTAGVASYTEGYNVMLTKGAESFPQVIIHEFVHTYNSKFVLESPVFITEGIPDIIAEIFTGRAAYGTYQTTSQVHLGIKTGADGRLLLSEGAGGYAFFRDVRSLVGDDALSRAVTRIFRGKVAEGVEVLKILKSETSNKRALEELYVSRIADYVPGSA